MLVSLKVLTLFIDLNVFKIIIHKSPPHTTTRKKIIVLMGQTSLKNMCQWVLGHFREELSPNMHALYILYSWFWMFAEVLWVWGPMLGRKCKHKGMGKLMINRRFCTRQTLMPKCVDADLPITHDGFILFHDPRYFLLRVHSLLYLVPTLSRFFTLCCSVCNACSSHC